MIAFPEKKSRQSDIYGGIGKELPLCRSRCCTGRRARGAWPFPRQGSLSFSRLLKSCNRRADSGSKTRRLCPEQAKWQLLTGSWTGGSRRRGWENWLGLGFDAVRFYLCLLFRHISSFRSHFPDPIITGAEKVSPEYDADRWTLSLANQGC